jgi:LPPG:FO 2-phospho-L-lactate transferase
VLVPTDDPLRTHIHARGRWRAFQEFMIRDRAEGPLEDIEYRGEAKPAPEAIEALHDADTIIIGPSNPVLSIDPILSVLQHELHAAEAPVVAVSPLVRGTVLKGPTAECLRWAGRTLDSDGIVDHYEGLIDALVADVRSEHVPTLETDVALNDPESRRRVAHEVLEFAAALA